MDQDVCEVRYAIDGSWSTVSVKWWTKVYSSITMLASDDTRYKLANSTYGFNDTSLFDDSRLLILLKQKENNHTPSIGDWLKTLEDLRNKFNISIIKECDGLDYCSGDFREFVLAYNNVHGYISLLVSNCLYSFYWMPDENKPK